MKVAVAMEFALDKAPNGKRRGRRTANPSIEIWWHASG
jgi:hypothetical protein